MTPTDNDAKLIAKARDLFLRLGGCGNPDARVVDELRTRLERTDILVTKLEAQVKRLENKIKQTGYVSEE